jgi:phosphogluconate dehydratase
LVTEAEWQGRTVEPVDLSANQWGLGRELFDGFRARATGAEEGAMSILVEQPPAEIRAPRVAAGAE